tara:strand:- start:628 stop:1308 length:681 start_codon:yes stop_codon:yes gene_type:complete
MTSTAILIPARFASTRFPGKPLTLLDSVPMIKRVYDTCIKSGLDTYVLTDDWSIAQLFDNNTCRVDGTDYQNGTERCAGALKLIRKYDQYINVQGDMPDVTQDMIEKTVRHLNHYQITTIFTKMDTELQNDPNTVKMVRSGDKALWFARGMTGYGEHHLGIYGYKRDVLKWYPTLDVTEEETVEQLEQLRWLKAGYNVGCLHTEFNGLEINTPEDVEKWYNNSCIK